MRLEKQRVFNQLCYLATEGRRVDRSLRREVDAVGVTSENHMRPIISRAKPATSSALPLQAGEVDGAPGRHRCPLAPRCPVLAAIEGDYLTAGLMEQSL